MVVTETRHFLGMIYVELAINLMVKLATKQITNLHFENEMRIEEESGLTHAVGLESQ